MEIINPCKSILCDIETLHCLKHTQQAQIKAKRVRHPQKNKNNPNEASDNNPFGSLGSNVIDQLRREERGLATILHETIKYLEESKTTHLISLEANRNLIERHISSSIGVDTSQSGQEEENEINYTQDQIDQAIEALERDAVVQILEHLKPFRLTKQEKVNIINLLPSSAVEFYSIVEEAEERFNPEAVEHIISLVNSCVPIRNPEIEGEPEGGEYVHEDQLEQPEDQLPPDEEYDEGQEEQSMGSEGDRPSDDELINEGRFATKREQDEDD